MNYNEENVRKYMKAVAHNFVVCGSVMCAELAESTAKAFYCNPDEGTPDLFYELAYEVAIEYESGDEAQNEFGANL
jgi:hypothetical protein